MSYYPTTVPVEAEQLSRYLNTELSVVADAINDAAPNALFLRKLSNPPDRPQDGQVVYADGVNWNPGSGVGVYYFNGTIWVFLG